MEDKVNKLTPHRIKEFDDTLASIHENLSQDNPYTAKCFKKVDEDQVKTGVKNIPPEDGSQPNDVEGNHTQNII